MPEPSPPLVSIITPAYNASRWLKETLRSVQAQSFPRWEWLITEDGSDDDTAALLSRLADGEPRIQIFGDGENHGAAAARNTALAAARGDFLAFLDCDDRWEPDKLSRQLDYLRAHPEADGVATWYELFGDPERVRRGVRVHPSSPICSREEALQGMTFLTSSLMLRRAVYEEEGGMDTDPRLRSGQDYEYFFRIISAHRIHRLPEVLTGWRVEAQDASLSTSNRSRDNARGWRLLDVLIEKRLISEREAQLRRSFLHYETGRNNLIYLGGPFRRHLLRSILAGHPPTRAFGILAASVLPAPLLRPLLLSLQRQLKKHEEGPS